MTQTKKIPLIIMDCTVQVLVKKNPMQLLEYKQSEPIARNDELAYTTISN